MKAPSCRNVSCPSGIPRRELGPYYGRNDPDNSLVQLPEECRRMAHLPWRAASNRSGTREAIGPRLQDGIEDAGGPSSEDLIINPRRQSLDGRRSTERPRARELVSAGDRSGRRASLATVLEHGWVTTTRAETAPPRWLSLPPGRLLGARSCRRARQRGNILIPGRPTGRQERRSPGYGPS